MAQRSEEWNRLRALARQTGDIRRVAHPLEQSYGLGLGVAESPDRMLASAVATVDRSTDADDLTDGPGIHSRNVRLAETKETYRRSYT